jgi:DNA-binding NarL/FixJ family response regulator
MGLEEATIKLQVKRLISKLGVSNRTQVAVAAIGQHLV